MAKIIPSDSSNDDCDCGERGGTGRWAILCGEFFYGADKVEEGKLIARTIQFVDRGKFDHNKGFRSSRAMKQKKKEEVEKTLYF